MSKVLTPPPGLRIMESADIRKALLCAAGPAKWNEEDFYHDADQAKLIGRALVAEQHRHLRKERIGYLFRKKLAGRDKIHQLARASLAGRKLAYYAEIDFLIEVNWEAWMHITPTQRVALIDHELCHFGVDEDKDGKTKHLILPHDLEEFGAVVGRWGFWEEGLAQFGATVREQLELLGSDFSHIPVRGD